MKKNTDDLFKKLGIKKVNLHKQIADRIQKLIEDEHLEPGTRLPPERTLAEQMVVNRATLREGIRLLEQRGLVKMKPGMGTFVVNVPIHTVSDSLQRYTTLGLGGTEDLLVLREILEPEIAALAAENATNEEVEELKAKIEIMDKAVNKNDVSLYVSSDEDFHELLAKASRNELIAGIMKGLRNNLIDHRRFIIKELHEENRRANLDVFEAVLKKKPEAARKAMKSHMSIARRAFEAVRKVDKER
jgi:GntR family transcriptional repressor for pyruvate dehydrogenase complex